MVDSYDLDESLQTIMEWGKYEAAAYRVLVRYGPLEASEVVVRADIPQGRVYDILNNLHSQDAVVKQGVQPTNWDAQNPRKLIEPNQRRFEDMAVEAIEALEPAYDLNLESESHPAWVTTGVAAASVKARELFEQAQERIWILERTFWLSSRDKDLLQSKAEEGIDVRIVGWSGRQALQNVAEEIPSAKFREADKVDTSFYVGDEGTVLINLNQGDTGMLFHDAGTAKIFTEHFASIYESANKVHA
ncbi:TrmB family transcriptional regulator [Halorarum halophilum]|uniref:TrmB family transcriptional regulator n=1 Tax=Halorarum halophilum TaxID=2743090 RepID=A0A7D5KN39_9EURY|nr:TrmB family transcriptional regulator [Halobaculum halophilum]QLG28182.1 TrmB family transcriptional regulator [Halobaculum halophilum]